MAGVKLYTPTTPIKIKTISYSTDDEGFTTTWNPLTDDGDALRLAVKLELIVEQLDGDCAQAMNFHKWDVCEFCFYKDGDPYAATRRAIVRAAAAIGKEMK